MFTETEIFSFWWNIHHWLYWKLSFWQLPVQPVMKISSKWRPFHFKTNAYISKYKSLQIGDISQSYCCCIMLDYPQKHVWAVTIYMKMHTKSAETCGLDNVFPPWPLFPSKNLCYYIYSSIHMHRLYEFCYKTYIYTYTGSVVQYWWSCTPSQSIGLFFGECVVPVLNNTFCFLWFTNCVLFYDK